MVATSVAMSTRAAVGAYLPSWANGDFSGRLPRPTIPVRAVVGEHDPALGEHTIRATWAEQLPGSEVTVLREAGHYAMYEAPVSLMTAIERTLGASISVT
jgi:pimeloyl-ACP methyl ester carboxylesterase